MDKKEISDSKLKLSFRAGWTIKLLWASAALYALAIPCVLVISFMPEPPALWAIVAGVGMLAFAAVLLCCAVFYLMWLHAAAKNKFVFNKDGFMENAKTGKKTFMMTPAWTVAWNLIPILNYFMPYIAMKQILFATNSKPYNAPDDAMKLVKWWWAMFLLMNFVPSFAGFAFGIAYCVLSVKLVSKITDLQTAKLDALAAGCETVADAEFEVLPDSPKA